MNLVIRKGEKMAENKINTSTLFRAWALAYVKETYGYDVSEDDHVELTAEISGEGCCELCYTETATTVLTVGKYTVNINNYFTG